MRTKVTLFSKIIIIFLIISLQLEEQRVLDDLVGVEVGRQPEPHTGLPGHGVDSRGPGHLLAGLPEAITPVKQQWRLATIYL
jgi:hypothetical protein